MTSINYADGVFKIRPKFGIVADLGWDGIINGWLIDVFCVERMRGEYKKHVSEVSEHNLWIYLLFLHSTNHTHLDIVSFECWKRSPTCLIVRLVTDMYRKTANCSSNETYLEFLWSSC